MVGYQRYYYQQLKKGEGFVNDLMGIRGGDHEELQIGHKKAIIRPKFLSFLFLSILSCSLIWAPQLFGLFPTFSLLYSLGAEHEQMSSYLPLCSSISNGTICCDRSSVRTDICYIKGDIRTHSSSSSIFLYTKNDPRGFYDFGESLDEIEEEQEFQSEKIRPYTRKWETSIMKTIDELTLVSKNKARISQHECEVWHDVAAIFFSTGGYTGNVYHEFNDGLIPLYITSQHLNKKVVFVILEYHNWWLTKYGDILSHLSDYPPIDFNKDHRTHCFPEAIIGLNIHDELTIDHALMSANKSIRDFRDLLDRAYKPRIKGLIQDEERERQTQVPPQLPLSPSSTSLLELAEELKKPKVVILSRNGSRAITNEALLVKVAERIGFRVEVVRPDRTTDLAKIYRALNSSDVMLGVHGAAMTHFLFLKPENVFIQVIPLGTNWAAETYYGEPAVRLGLRYIGYKILPRESSLYNEYDRNDPVLRDPESVNKKGWEYTKRIYLDNQNVSLDLRRFQKRLIRAYDYSVSRRTRVSLPRV